MLKYYNYDIVCQEIPDQITLAVNISGCPNRCSGCHSPWLWEDIGDMLDVAAVDSLLERYGSAVTCVCFMGGDREPKSVERLAAAVRAKCPHLKTAWYSGRETIAPEVDIEYFDFVKIGRYVASLGGLKSPATNQRLYEILPDGTKKHIGLNLMLKH